jgi:parallel beta-helix repeat protein
MAQRDIYAFDCGTTNWRIYRNSCADGPADTRAGDPAGALQCVALRAFDGRHLPVALLLDESGRVRGQGKVAYEMVDDDPARRPYLRDAFKPCIGNRGPVDPMDPTRRYSHDQALDCTRALLALVLGWLREEKLGDFAADQLFYFAHPVHWGREAADGTITGDLLADFARVVRGCFPEPIRGNVHFVREPDGALASLAQSGQLLAGDRLTLVVDAGGGTTDFMAGRWGSGGLQDVRSYGEPLGGGVFDNDLAQYVAEVLAVREPDREGVWAELRSYGRRLKEGLSKQMLVDEAEPVAMKITLELPGAAGSPPEYLSHRLRFSRSDFEQRTRHTAEQFKLLTREALVRMDLKVSEIGQVVLVGGGANLYLVPRLLKEVFTKVPVVYGDPPEETIARGAALWYAKPEPKPQSLTVKPDGSGDYPTLHEAIGAVSEGGTINLTQGQYRLARPLLIERSVQLVGDGMDTTTLLGEGEECVVRFSGPGRLELKGITIRHEGKIWADVVVAIGGELRTEHCRLKGGVRDVMGKRGGDGLRLCGEVWGQIGGCLVEVNEGCGIRVQERAHPTLEGNTCRLNGAGIGFSHTATGVVRKNECIENRYNGIQVCDESQPMLDKNICRENGSSGIRVGEQAQPTLEGNLCWKNKQAGIVFFGDTAGMARRNECNWNGNYGIYVSGLAHPTLEENTCRENMQKGIEIADAARPRILP